MIERSSLLRMFIRNIIKRFLIRSKRTTDNPAYILSEVCGFTQYHAQNLYEGQLPKKEVTRLQFAQELRPLLSSGKKLGPKEQNTLLRLLQGEYVTEEDVKVKDSEVPMVELTFIKNGNVNETTTSRWTLDTIEIEPRDKVVLQEHIKLCDFEGMELEVVNQLITTGEVCANMNSFSDKVGISFGREGISGITRSITKKLEAHKQAVQPFAPGKLSHFIVSSKNQAMHTPITRRVYCFKKIVYVTKEHRKVA